MELLLRMDSKGRILIPARIRKRLGLKHVVRMRVEEDRLIIESVKDPIESLVRTVIEGSSDVEKEIASFRRLSGREAVERARERWP